MGRVDGAAMTALVKHHQLDITIVLIPELSEAFFLLSEALGVESCGDLAPSTEAWPFVD